MHRGILLFSQKNRKEVKSVCKTGLYHPFFVSSGSPKYFYLPPLGVTLPYLYLPSLISFQSVDISFNSTQEKLLSMKPYRAANQTLQL